MFDESIQARTKPLIDEIVALYETTGAYGILNHLKKEVRP